MIEISYLFFEIPANKVEQGRDAYGPISHCVVQPSVKEKRMKKPLAASLIAIPLLILTFHANAVVPEATTPVTLTSNQMDEVTAGGRHAGWGRSFSPTAWRAAFMPTNTAEITQVNISPVTIIQIGNNNTAIVYSGNFSWIYQ